MIIEILDKDKNEIFKMVFSDVKPQSAMVKELIDLINKFRDAEQP